MASTTFKVAPVEENKLSYPPNSVAEISDTFLSYWDKKGRTKFFDKEEKKQESKPSMEFEVGAVNHEDLIKPGHKRQPQGHHHGFINAVLTAYSNHYPLVLSPDDFWLLLSLAVSKFLGSDKEMAEKYRYTFVDHEGKIELVVNGEPHGIVPKSPKANKEGWPGFVEDICALVKQNTKTDISDIMTTPFSSSGSVENTVMGVTLMEAMKNYFSYRCICGCGIPYITLEGTPEDYQSIIERTEKLENILPDLAWYFSRARGHLKKIKASVEGEVDTDFWRTMVIHKREGSGVLIKFTGWIADFFTNLMGSTYGKDWRRMNLDYCNAPAVTFTPFKLDDQQYTMKVYDMKLMAGFLGVAVDEKNKNAIRPAIGWMTYYVETADEQEGEEEEEEEEERRVRGRRRFRKVQKEKAEQREKIDEQNAEDKSYVL